MALFNITNKRINNTPAQERELLTSNTNINISTTSLRISKLQITEQEWLGN